jgi:hypothetical protein
MQTLYHFILLERTIETDNGAIISNCLYRLPCAVSQEETKDRDIAAYFEREIYHSHRGWECKGWLSMERVESELSNL